MIAKYNGNKKQNVTLKARYGIWIAVCGIFEVPMINRTITMI